MVAAVVISGDTAFSPALARAARGTDLLVHEAIQPRIVGLLTRAKRVALLAVAMATTATAQTQVKSPVRPNIVILLADDWGFTDVGSFGSEIRTPNIDALAADGVRFANFHVAGSCSPTRAMLQTGVASHRAGLGNMPETIPPEHIGKPGYDTVLNNRVLTIAQRLRPAGYRTYFVGKWHLGSTPDTLPGARGYDRAFALADAGADNFEQKPIIGLYDHAAWTEDGRTAKLPPRFYSSTFIVDKTIAYIDSGRATGRPFLASVNFLANHIPVQAPDAYIARYATRYTGGWQALRSERAARAGALGIVPANAAMVAMPGTPDWSSLAPAERSAQARAMAAYGAMAEAADHEIGRLVAHLKRTGDYANTVFVFLSDNGPEPTEPRRRWLNRIFLGLNYDSDPAQAGRRGTLTAIGAAWASAAASPLSGYKFSATEGGLRVPMILAWPGNPAVSKGRISHGLSHVTDIAPTLLSLARVPELTAPEAMTGADLTPVLADPARRAHAPDQPIGYELAGNAALFRGDYKLVKNLPPIGDGQWRLYDIAVDPGETRDLSTADPARFRAMQSDYAAFAHADQVLPMPPGYTADDQINANAFRKTAPAVMLWIGLPLLLIVLAITGGVWRWRRPRAAINP